MNLSYDCNTAGHYECKNCHGTPVCAYKSYYHTSGPKYCGTDAWMEKHDSCDIALAETEVVVTPKPAMSTTEEPAAKNTTHKHSGSGSGSESGSGSGSESGSGSGSASGSESGSDSNDESGSSADDSESETNVTETPNTVLLVLPMAMSLMNLFILASHQRKLTKVSQVTSHVQVVAEVAVVMVGVIRT